jgi:uncharacterized Zn finger protein
MDRAPGIDAVRVKVDGDCPSCGESALARYEVLSEGGWFQVVKCTECLHSVERNRWKLLGYVHREGVGQ